MLQNLSEEICECLHRAEECKRLSQTALTPSAIKDYLEMEQRWLALARSYEFAQRLSRFTKAAQEAKKQIHGWRKKEPDCEQSQTQPAKMPCPLCPKSGQIAERLGMSA